MEQTRQMRRKYVAAVLAVFVAACVAIEVTAVGVLSVPAETFSTIFLFSAFSLLLYTAVSAVIYFKMLDRSPMAMARYYMIHTMARFVFGGIVLFVCHCIAPQGSKPALVGFSILFLTLLVSESVIYIQIERYLNENKSHV